NNKTESYLICPYGILRGNKLYLIGTGDKSELYKYFILSKITSCTETNEYFDMNEEFDIEDFKKHTFGIWQGKKYNVKLKFPIELKEKITNYIFHPTQKITFGRDEIFVEFTASGEVEICREIYKWEPSVQILEPHYLIQHYKTTLKKALNKYE
ncbi:MAG: WYL domain-containing protein, partial [Candidatus Gastranaerophilales bacterium]|nr:WYL domain-containing protein [Candidatus Gastranaerophilales bacterium]